MQTRRIGSLDVSVVDEVLACRVDPRSFKALRGGVSSLGVYVGERHYA